MTEQSPASLKLDKGMYPAMCLSVAMQSEHVVPLDELATLDAPVAPLAPPSREALTVALHGLPLGSLSLVFRFSLFDSSIRFDIDSNSLIPASGCCVARFSLRNPSPPS